MNLTHCQRCGRKMPIGPYATNKKFCTTRCYRAWWKDQKVTSTTQEERLRKQLGEAPTFTLNDVQSSWLAATVDGEGSVGIWRQRSNDRNGYKYRPVVCVFNTNAAFLAQVSKLVDGWYHIKQNPARPNHKTTWVVRVKDRAVPALLEQIKQHLIIKRKQADLVLEFCRAVAASPVHNREMQPEFERLYRECKMLNKRGVT